MLITARDAHRDVSLQACEFVSLRSHDAYDVALLALNTELSDCSRQVSLLIRCDCRANDQGAKTAKSQEKLRQSFIFQNELQRLAIDKDTVLLVLIKEVKKCRLIIGHL